MYHRAGWAMVELEIFMEIRRLRVAGLSVSEIARGLGLDRKTVRKYLRVTHHQAYKRKERAAKLELYAARMRARLEQSVGNVVQLLRELRSRGYTGCASQVRRWLQPWRREAAERAFGRFETEPEQQAQFGWGRPACTYWQSRWADRACGSRLGTHGCGLTLFPPARMKLELAEPPVDAVKYRFPRSPDWPDPETLSVVPLPVKNTRFPPKVTVMEPSEPTLRVAGPPSFMDWVYPAMLQLPAVDADTVRLPVMDQLAAIPPGHGWSGMGESMVMVPLNDVDCAQEET